MSFRGGHTDEIIDSVFTQSAVTSQDVTLCPFDRFLGCTRPLGQGGWRVSAAGDEGWLRVQGAWFTGFTRD